MSTYNSVIRLLTQEAVRPLWLKEMAHQTAQIKPGRHLSSQFVTYLSKAAFPQHFVEDKAVYVEFSPCSSRCWLVCVSLPDLPILTVICWSKQGGESSVGAGTLQHSEPWVRIRYWHIFQCICCWNPGEHKHKGQLLDKLFVRPGHGKKKYMLLFLTVLIKRIV